jgi:putative transposase
MCRVLKVAKSGYYAWVGKPLSDRAVEDNRLLKAIKDSHAASDSVYGSPRVYLDLRAAGERIGKKRIARIMRENEIRAVCSRKASPRRIASVPSTKIPNRLDRQFNVTERNRVWVTDITYIRTWESWLYLAAVMDLSSRKIVGWSMDSTLERSLALDAIRMAVWRRRPTGSVLIHSDQGSQFWSEDWARFCRENRLEPSMSRRGNCWDNAVAESFFSSLKKERIRNKVYRTREIAKADIFDYIEDFYNRRRRHSYVGGVSPEAFEHASVASL